MAVTDFTLSNIRRFYLSMGNPLGVKGLICTLICKAIISKQILGAFINCLVSQQVAFDSFYRWDSFYHNFSSLLLVESFLASVCNSCQYHSRLIASFEFQKNYWNKNNNLNFHNIAIVCFLIILCRTVMEYEKIDSFSVGVQGFNFLTL